MTGTLKGDWLAWHGAAWQRFSKQNSIRATRFALLDEARDQDKKHDHGQAQDRPENDRLQ